MQPEAPTVVTPYGTLYVSTVRRYVILVLACLLSIGNDYCYDIPAALNLQLREWLNVDYNSFQFKLNLLYSGYSLPNAIIPLMTGIFVDRYGSHKIILVITVILLLGNTIFSLGVQMRLFWVMLLGRICAGIGGESLEVASGTVITRWFRRRTLAMAIGINLSLARIASAAQKLASPWIVRNYELPYATWFGSSLCVLSFVCALALKWTDRQYNREATEVNADDNDEIPRPRQPSKPTTTPSLARNVGTTKALENSTGRTVRIVEQKSQAVDRRLSTSSLSDDLLESFQSTKRWFSTSLNGDWEKDRSIWKKTQAFLRKFMLPKKFWLLNFATVALYTSVYPFYIIFSDFLQTRFYPGDPQAAATVMTIPDLCTAIGPPIFGLFIDKVGHRGKFIPLAGLLVCTVHALFHFTTVSPVITSLLLGFSHVMFYTCTWVCVPDVVKPSQLGIGYGIVAASVDLSITVCPLLVAFIRSISPDFTNVGILLLSMSGLSVILSTILVIMDIRHGQSMQLKRLPTRKVRTLNRPSNATDKNSAVKTTKSESKDTKPDSDSTECEIKDPQCDVENATSEVKNSNSEVASSNWEVKDVQWQESKLFKPASQQSYTWINSLLKLYNFRNFDSRGDMNGKVEAVDKADLTRTRSVRSNTI